MEGELRVTPLALMPAASRKRKSALLGMEIFVSAHFIFELYRCLPNVSHLPTLQPTSLPITRRRRPK